ncbi:CPBP family glutamic-type intramembrane protease [Planococcus sp. N064]|uniref:CPBP family glutamic-type intramembrane protease n=1 Tax=Planococcus liqunii TaxID=3058394 RepID=A0ABT8MRM2_9BACL|nr:CPBP family intramembrane glutamic endopeptidase [Planococcus sp. N064]MDN7227484.1 CPBP family glutamic-type intramembrane protease [Planococcus sp. N064]
MTNALRLIGPTMMIFIGLQVMENVAITFLLFYSWLLFVPLIDRAFPVEQLKLDKQGVALGFGSGLLFFIFIFGGLSWLHVYLLDIEYLRTLLMDWGFSGRGEILLVLVLLLANPVLEELYWRGYMFNRLRMKGSALYAVGMSAAFYTLYHLLSIIPIFEAGFSFVAVLPVFIAGLFWGFIREKSGSMTATIISHVLSDFGIVCVYWFIVR